MVLMLCGCQPRQNEPAAGDKAAGRPAPNDVHIERGTAERVADGGATNAVGIGEAGETAAQVMYAPRAGAAPVRLGKIETRFGHTEVSATARERRLDAKTATQLINARSDKLVERYGGQDTSPRAGRVEKGPVLLEAGQARRVAESNSP